LNNDDDDDNVSIKSFRVVMFTVCFVELYFSLYNNFSGTNARTHTTRITSSL